MCSNFHLVFCSRSNECSERKLSLAVLRCVRKSVFLCHCAELGSFGHFGGVPCIPFMLDVIDSSDILFRIKEEEERKKRTNDTKLLFFAPKCARIIRLPICHVVGFTRQGTAAGTQPMSHCLPIFPHQQEASSPPPPHLRSSPSPTCILLPLCFPSL